MKWGQHTEDGCEACPERQASRTPGNEATMRLMLMERHEDRCCSKKVNTVDKADRWSLKLLDSRNSRAGSQEASLSEIVVLQYFVREIRSTMWVRQVAFVVVPVVGSQRRVWCSWNTEEQASQSASDSSSSSVIMLCGYRSVSALGLGLTSTTLLSGVQCELTSDVVDAGAVYRRKPFATASDISTSDS
jgi:hypothetical protein